MNLDAQVCKICRPDLVEGDSCTKDNEKILHEDIKQVIRLFKQYRLYELHEVAKEVLKGML